MTSRNISPAASTELRHLPLQFRTQLVKLLDSNNSWEQLAINIPHPDKDEPLYSTNEMRILEEQLKKPRGSPANMLLEHWGTTGRRRPTIADLLEKLVKAELYRAADFISMDVLKGPPVPKPLHSWEAHLLPLPPHPTDPQEEQGPTTCAELNSDVPAQLNEQDLKSVVQEHHICSDTSSQSTPSNNVSQGQAAAPNCQSPAVTETRNFLGIVQESVVHFPYRTLAVCTRNFNVIPKKRGGSKIGEGAFGAVFHGVLENGQNIAVKRLKDAVEEQFITEVKVLTEFTHENLLSLIGYSCDGPAPCLVYSFMINGSLQDRLACMNGTLPIPWLVRVSIALGTAKGICHLHTHKESPLVHRDIKSANILLDGNFVPKVGDFGLARIGARGTTSTVAMTSCIIGTSVYMAREAFQGDISVKLDTFSFGVVLLELLTGLPPYDDDRDDPDIMTYFEERDDDFLKYLDAAAGQWDQEVAGRLHSISKDCTKERKKNRPTMVEVLPSLESLTVR